MASRGAAFACEALIFLAGLCAPTWGAPGGPPPGAELRDATIAIGYETKGRCPDLMQADTEDSSAELVVLVVGPSGVPSQPSIKSSSGSETLDAAAISCVMKLRFLPAVRAGEGSAMASWQEIAWKWGRAHVAPSPPASGTAAATATAPLGPTTGVSAAGSGTRPGAGGAEVRVCADESGRLTGDPVITRSSGDAALDEAAVRIARSGAPYYRPAGAAALSGCAQLAIKFETK
jgi:TonB family protein